jgi:hypothetical protein
MPDRAAYNATFDASSEINDDLASQIISLADSLGLHVRHNRMTVAGETTHQYIVFNLPDPNNWQIQQSKTVLFERTFTTVSDRGTIQERMILHYMLDYLRRRSQDMQNG